MRWKGIVEGFYYEPWTHAGRLRALRFMGAAGLDSYIYAPKADPNHRDAWREAYPAESPRRFRALVRAAEAEGVEFFWSVSPGLTISYSGRADFDALLARLLELAAAGVKSFGLFLDDIPETLPEGDKAFAGLADAQVAVANRIHDELKKRVEVVSFLFCPTEYWGVRSTPYLETIGAELHSDIGVFWTGEYVVSPLIAAAQAKTLASILKRKPVLWDNYPVNDYNRRKLHLGPLMGRPPDLAAQIDGFFANPMNEEQCSLVSLWTVADYLRDPAGYDPRASWERAVKRVGGRAAAPLRRLAEIFYPGIFPGEPIPPVVAAIRRFESSPSAAEMKKNGRSLLRELKALCESAEKFAAATDNKLLLREMSGSLKKLKAACAAAAEAVDAKLSAGEEAAAHARRARRLLAKAGKIEKTLYGSALESFAARALADKAE